MEMGDGASYSAAPVVAAVINLLYTFFSFMSQIAKWLVVVSFLVASLILPIWLAGTFAYPDHIFGGFLFNPLDGNSYLAKMQLGWRGDWSFNLLYTPESGQGAPIFLFYIFLGHLARTVSLPLIGVFHIARVVGAIFLLFSLWKFYRWFFKEQPATAWWAFLISSVGSGLGWMVSLVSGYLTGDFWIAEAFPYLSMVANPHFSIGLGLILWILYLAQSQFKRSIWILPLLSIVLAVIQPFGIVVVGIPLVARLGLSILGKEPAHYGRFLAALVPGGVWLAVQYAIIRSNPLLALWNQQNVTPAVPLWDLVLSMFPAIGFAIAGVVYSWKTGQTHVRMLALWMAIGILLVYLPFNLQRRFMTGLFIPVAGLAALGIDWVLKKRPKARWIWPVLMVTSVLTNVLVIGAGVAAVVARDPTVFLTTGEARALEWLQANTAEETVVLTDLETGNFIPAWTGRRVVYGHPFESLHAEERRVLINRFFDGQMSAREVDEFISENNISIIWVGPRESQLSNFDTSSLKRIYDSNGVVLYSP